MLQTEEEREADVLVESMEEAFVKGIISRYTEIKGVGCVLECIRERTCESIHKHADRHDQIKMAVVTSFALGVTLGRSIGNLEKLFEKEEGVEITKGKTERDAGQS